MRILNLISNMVTSNAVFTDVHATTGRYVYAHMPGGYVQVSDFLVEERDMEDLLSFANPRWKEKIDTCGGFDEAMTIKGLARLRGNFYSCGGKQQIGVVMRKLPVEPPMPDQIGIPLALVNAIHSMPKGLIVISGPTGSGKSTTLASIIEMLNRNKPVSVVTIERPIEYVFEPKTSVIVQREVGTDIPSFADGVRAAKRQDPDVIMIGEIESREVMDAALTAACSGHLVLVTTHARSVQESCDSMLSYYSDSELHQKRALLASSLLAIQTQTLLPSADRKSFLLGYELFVVNNSTAGLLAALREGKTRDFANMISAGNDSNPNITSMNDCLLRLVSEGRVKPHDALTSAYDKESLSRKLTQFL